MTEDKIEWEKEAASRAHNVIADLAPNGEIYDDELLYILVLLSLSITGDSRKSKEMLVALGRRLDENASFFDSIIVLHELTAMGIKRSDSPKKSEAED
jgi:hypothetical protein